MAAELNHSSVLFVDDDGRPMRFSMRPCTERSRIKPLIEHGGGVITSKVDRGCIRLTDDDANVSTDGYVFSRYVWDCVKSNTLLDWRKYRVLQDYDDFSSDRSDENYIVKGIVDSTKGRKRFLLSEDMKIINYIIENRKQDITSGNSVWKEMGVLQITAHTWQAMKARYMKCILPNLRTYPIQEHQVAMLTGVIVPNNRKMDEWLSSRNSRKTEGKERRKSTTSDEEDIDDFDDLLVKACSETEAEEKDRKLNGQALPVEQSKRKKNSNENTQGPRLERRKRKIGRLEESMVNLVKGCPDESQQADADSENGEHEITFKNSQLFKPTSAKEIRKAVEKMTEVVERLGITEEELLDALYANNGLLDEAVHWIVHGTGTDGQAAWFLEDDQILEEGDLKTYQALERRRGEEAVRARREYLAENRI